VLVKGESKRWVAKREGISRNTLRKMVLHEVPPASSRRRGSPKSKQLASSPSDVQTRHQIVNSRWVKWLYELERGSLIGTPSPANTLGLTALLAPPPNNPRKKLLTVLAREQGFSARATAEHLGISRNTVRTYLASFDAGGVAPLLERKAKPRLADSDAFRKVLFGLLHEPPSLHGYNRTTWRLKDLKTALAAKGQPASRSVIGEAIRKAGYRWRSAKVVLTSNDPEYREKLQRVQAVLSKLRDDERFFSIDEFGPFAIKAKPGRVLAEICVVWIEVRRC
jgi:transposase